MKQEIYVRIYPKGVDRDGKVNKADECRVVLQSAEERERYVRAEYKFCRQQEDDHLAAIYRKDRIRTKGALELRRAEFARSQGYEGLGSNRWTKCLPTVQEILV